MARSSSAFSEVWRPMASGIDVSIIYSDLHLLQLQISAANGEFAGRVDTYVGHDEAKTISEELKGFPTSLDDVRRVEIGPNVSLTFSAVDKLGHGIVAIEMAGDIVGQNGLRQRAALNVLINPAEVDQFAAELAAFTSDVGQSAWLNGG